VIKLDHADDLAAALLRRLVHHIGDHDAIETELQDWLNELGIPSLSLVLLAAVRLTFEECLTITPLADIPAARLALLPTLPERTAA
jgi:hypothetical protein